jgi:beta-mannosidase
VNQPQQIGQNCQQLDCTTNKTLICFIDLIVFAVDWGPSFPSMGIWKPIYLQGYNSAILEEISVTQHFNHDQGFILANITTYIRGVEPSNVTLSLSLANQSLEQPIQISTFNAEGLNIQFFLIKFPIDSVELWWPVGYGPQPLYELTVSLSAAPSGEISTVSRRIGFRSVEIVREPYENEPGLSFYWKINQIPIFLKGANFIPIDSFHARVQESNITGIIDSLLLANGNIMRVWGGGIYQDNSLYDYADEKGLLIWQEFMFACAMVPVNDFFLDSVAAEVLQQTRRLSSHASIIVFGGNNENESAMLWFEQIVQHRDMYLVDYNRLYVETVMKNYLSVQNDPRDFVVSSPTNGPYSWEPFTQIWGNPSDETYGDLHYYNYIADCADVSIYPRARFISEFGFQSYPSLHTLNPAVAPQDLFFNSPIMLNRQHHPDGNTQLLSQLQRHFRLPTAQNHSLQLFADQIYLTQAVQSIAYSTALQFWRSIKGEKGHTMGIIYWQLNDIWQAPTWSSLEYQGRWKAVHYAVKRSFQPIIATGYVLNGTFLVYVVSDSMQNFQGQLSVSLMDYEGIQIYSNSTLKVNLQPLAAHRIFETPLFEVLQGHRPNKTFISLELFDGASNLVSSHIVYPASLASVELLDPKITLSTEATLSSGPISSLKLTLRCSNAAPYTWLDTSIPGTWSDNSIFCVPGRDYPLEFTGTAPFQKKLFQQNLQVKTLYSTHNSTGNEVAAKKKAEVSKNSILNWAEK